MKSNLSVYKKFSSDAFDFDLFDLTSDNVAVTEHEAKEVDEQDKVLSTFRLVSPLLVLLLVLLLPILVHKYPK